MLVKHLFGGLKRVNVGYRVLPRFSVCISRACTESESDRNRPVKFTTSNAANWRAEYTRSGTSTRVPAAQPYIINLCVAVFLVYFCILREENDIDEQLSVNLYDRVEGLEEADLRAAITYNESHGLDTTQLQKRLDEITRK